MNQKILDTMYGACLRLGGFAIPVVLVVGIIAWNAYSFKKCKSTIEQIRNRKPGQP